MTEQKLVIEKEDWQRMGVAAGDAAAYARQRRDAAAKISLSSATAMAQTAFFWETIDAFCASMAKQAEEANAPK